jgi:transcriptional regulator with XRE-family HTH domain
VNPAQCRAARALLDWSQADLMDRCGASQKTITDYERGLTRPYARTVTAIVEAFEVAGIEFINGDGPGVRLRSFFKSAAASTKKADATRNIITTEQSRAARGWLGWSQTELAKRANISLSTVRDFETGQRTPIANNLAAMRRVIEAAGIRLLFDQNKEAAGIVRQYTDPAPSR